MPSELHEYDMNADNPEGMWVIRKRYTAYGRRCQVFSDTPLRLHFPEVGRPEAEQAAKPQIAEMVAASVANGHEVYVWNNGVKEQVG
jgi:hypothetical protein